MDAATRREISLCDLVALVRELPPVTPPTVEGAIPVGLLEISWLTVTLSAALGNLAFRQDPQPLRGLRWLLVLLAPETDKWLAENEPAIKALWKQNIEAMLRARQHPDAPDGRK